MAQSEDSIVYIHGKQLKLLNTITGRIAPKSVVANGNGLFFAQNMMYKHTVTVYNRSYELVKTISDDIKLSDYGHFNFKGEYKGAPVECVFTHSGNYAWVSNYQMTGGTSKEFSKTGCDGCNSRTKYDSSYVYKINTKTFEIEQAVLVGSVPKFLAATPNNEKVLVTNWTSGDLSVIDTKLNKEIKRIVLGTFPRGIVVDKNSKFAYIAIMGSTKIAKLNLYDYSIEWITGVGRHPRHLCLSPDNKTLYISLNGEGKIAKLDLETKKIIKKSTGSMPRSMDISSDGRFLYVVNYGSNTVSKLETSSMNIITTAKTKSKPIGITYDDATKNIWTACYSGRIMIFHDTYYDSIALDIKKQQELLALQLRKEKEQSRSHNNDRIVISKTNYSSNPIENKPIDGRYILVSGSFLESDRARRRVDDLKEKAISSSLYFNEENGRSYAYIGVFNSKEEAYIASKNQKVDNWIYSLPKKYQGKIEASKVKEIDMEIPTDLPFVIVSGSYNDESYAKRKVIRLQKINKGAFVYYNKASQNYYACLGSFESRIKAKFFLDLSEQKGWIFER